MNITLIGPAARVAIVVGAIVGFILALGDVLDVYDALWKVTAPLTLVYAALIWRFALRPPRASQRRRRAGRWGWRSSSPGWP